MAASGGRDLRWWPLALLLLALVALPSACLLWLMGRAIENERLAVRQVLAESCRGGLSRLRHDWEAQWQARARDLDRVAAGKAPAERFAAIIEAGLADSAFVRGVGGRDSYPTMLLPLKDVPWATPEWIRAGELEASGAQQASKLLDAAGAYAAIAKSATDADLAALALQAQARSLAKAGRPDEAVAVLTGPLAEERFRRSLDSSGRLISADAELRVLELIGDPATPRFHAIAEGLAKRLNDYFDPLLGSAQRLFLMKRLDEMAGDSIRLPTLRAEELAAAFLESGTPLTEKFVLIATRVAGVWQFASGDGLSALPSGLGEGTGRVVALLRAETIEGELRELANQEHLPAGVQVTLLAPDRPGDPAGFLNLLPVGDRLPGWQIGLSWNDEALVGAATRGKVAAYLITGLLAVTAASALAISIAWRFARQARLTRLKNDLVAAVSHELKTPLASIRLLVDTLLAAETPDIGTTREYLELIAKENIRLSRLIDNFLTFSRMERNKQAFSFVPTDPNAIVATAADAVRERFEQAGCRLDVGVEPDLPLVAADADAMTTALVNLLENAWKYTEGGRQIALRAYRDADDVCFDVTDNGIGLSRADCRRVFERFYQVDRELSRTRGGCGLGLSIVEFIVKAHGGRVTVQSRPGQGSTFTIALPRTTEA